MDPFYTTRKRRGIGDLLPLLAAAGSATAAGNALVIESKPATDSGESDLSP